MKTAISLPDELHAAADRLAGRTGRSRSQLYSDALREYLARHASDNITEAMNRVVDTIEEGEDAFLARARRLGLERVEW